MDLLASLEGSTIATWLREANTIWAYPLVLTLHTVGLAVLVGANAALDLRVLGFAEAIPLRELAGTFRVMWIGFWINAVSGILLFAADATTKGATTLFAAKLVMIVVAVVLMFRLKRAVYGRGAAEGGVTGGAKALAAASLVLWVAAITAGRYMAYI